MPTRIPQTIPMEINMSIPLKCLGTLGTQPATGRLMERGCRGFVCRAFILEPFTTYSSGCSKLHEVLESEKF